MNMNKLEIIKTELISLSVFFDNRNIFWDSLRFSYTLSKFTDPSPLSLLTYFTKVNNLLLSYPSF